MGRAPGKARFDQARLGLQFARQIAAALLQMSLLLVDWLR